MRLPLGVGALGLAVGLVIGGWVAGRQVRPPAPPDLRAVNEELARPVGLRPNRALALWTDKGHRVRTYECVSLPGGRDPTELEVVVLGHFSPDFQIIREAGPDPGYNCHGWTFAAGLCWIQGDEAEAVLRENEYRRADPPQAGDVVIYRDDGGRLCHSGVVVGVSPAGAVLVESKWGWLGRYVHPVQTQSYATRWHYYRSPRPGHHLTGVRGQFPVTPR